MPGHEPKKGGVDFFLGMVEFFFFLKIKKKHVFFMAFLGGASFSRYFDFCICLKGIFGFGCLAFKKPFLWDYFNIS